MAACKVGTLPELLDPEDGQLLTTWATATRRDARGNPISFVNGTAALSAAALSLALFREGHDVSPTALKDHRGGRCGCYRQEYTA